MKLTFELTNQYKATKFIKYFLFLSNTIWISNHRFLSYLFMKSWLPVLWGTKEFLCFAESRITFLCPLWGLYKPQTKSKRLSFSFFGSFLALYLSENLQHFSTRSQFNCQFILRSFLLKLLNSPFDHWPL